MAEYVSLSDQRKMHITLPPPPRAARHRQHRDKWSCWSVWISAAARIETRMAKKSVARTCTSTGRVSETSGRSQYRPTFRDWEWGLLMNVCVLDAHGKPMAARDVLNFVQANGRTITGYRRIRRNAGVRAPPQFACATTGCGNRMQIATPFGLRGKPSETASRKSAAGLRRGLTALQSRQLARPSGRSAKLTPDVSLPCGGSSSPESNSIAGNGEC